MAHYCPGLEDKPSICLQCHMDMVVEKNDDVQINFETDPLTPRIVDNKWLMATGTSLGADDGIGVATCFAILADPSLKHGPLEVLITRDEETGMFGALELEPGLLRSPYLINVDSEEENALCIGCAGGFTVDCTLPVTRSADPKTAVLRVTLNDSTRQFITEKAGTRISTEGNTVRYEAREESETTEMHTLLIPRGGEFHMELADGTQVWLNSESKLTYPARFTGGTREVAMEGEVCFQVAKNEAQPFIVRTGGMAVTVLGTVFNVDAYPDNGRIATTLVEGKVEIQAGDEKQTLLPDQQAVLEKGKGIEVKKVYAEDYISWIGGVFHFTEASLEEIMQKLSRWYNFEFFFANADVKDAHFTLNIRRYENVSDILSKIEKTGRAHFNINRRTVVVSE